MNGHSCHWTISYDIVTQDVLFALVSRYFSNFTDETESWGGSSLVLKPLFSEGGGGFEDKAREDPGNKAKLHTQR